MKIDLSPKRKQDESFEEYKKRRSINNKTLKKYLKKGRVFHSAEVYFLSGKLTKGKTYVKDSGG